MADGLWIRLDVGDLWIHQRVNFDATAGSLSSRPLMCEPHSRNDSRLRSKAPLLEALNIPHRNDPANALAYIRCCSSKKSTNNRTRAGIVGPPMKTA